MDLDAMLLNYFGSTDPDSVDDVTLDQGVERMVIDLAKETDPGRRFALWALLHGVGHAPDPGKVFKTPKEREAAQAYALLMSSVGDGEDG